MAKQGTKTTIAEANVVITGDLSGVTRATKQAEQQVDRSAKKIKKDLNDAVKIDKSKGAYETTGAYEIAGGVPSRKYSKRSAVEISTSNDAAFNKRLSRIKARRLKRKLRGYNSPTGFSQKVGRLRGDVGKALIPVAIATQISKLIADFAELANAATLLRASLADVRHDIVQNSLERIRRKGSPLEEELHALDVKRGTLLQESEKRINDAKKTDLQTQQSFLAGGIRSAILEAFELDATSNAIAEEKQTRRDIYKTNELEKQAVIRDKKLETDRELSKFFADLRANTQETVNQIKQQASRGRR